MERPDTPVLLQGRIFWSMYYAGQLYWVQSEHHGYPELPAAQELERIREIDRQRLNTFIQEPRKRPQLTETDLTALARTQRLENQKLRHKFKSGDQAQAARQSVPEGVVIKQFTGRDWSVYDRFPDLEFSLQPAPPFSLEMVVVDQRELDQAPALSASDQLIVERLFGRIPFERLDFALKWCWSKTDVERDPGRMTYARAVRQKWCSSRDESALKARFAKFDYGEPCITQDSYFYLEELEKTFQASPLEIKEEHRREQTRNRVAGWQANLSREAQDRIKRADRQRKNRLRKRHQKFCQDRVTDNCPESILPSTVPGLKHP